MLIPNGALDRPDRPGGFPAGPRPPAFARGFFGILLVAGLVAFPAVAEERFHLFPETEASPPPALRVRLEGLPSAAPLEALAAASARPAAPRAERKLPKAPEPLPPYPTEKRFAAAMLETVGLNLLPWAIDSFLLEEDYAQISASTIKHNLQTGFTYDFDMFVTNQVSHSYHGSAYFNAARTNGYSFWESASFAFGTSFLWEMFLEAQPASINDLVNTTLGGMAWGETQFRVANMIFDNKASGFGRFLREAAGFVVNPMGGFNRLIRGEMMKDFQNPPDRFPRRLYMELDGGYVHSGGSVAEGTTQDQGSFSFLLRYGDPFDGALRQPFEIFDVQLGFRAPASSLLTRIDIDGLLALWNLSENPSSGQRLALFMSSKYFRNDPQNYGAQAFGARHLARLPLGRETDLRTEASVIGIPMGVCNVDYPEEGLGSPYSRPYDYGPGLGAQASVRVRRREVDLLVLDWSVVGLSTSNGLSKGSRLQTLAAEARVPLTSSLLLGGGWSWSERLTTYDSLPTVHLTGTTWRFFAGWAIPRIGDIPDRGNANPSPSGGTDVAARWDLSAFAGYFMGSRVYTGVDRNVLMTTSPLYGLRAGYRLTRVFGLEASWSHAATKLRPTDPATGEANGAETPVAVDSWELDGLFEFGGRRVRGYVGLGGGVQVISPSVPTLDSSGGTARFAANVVLGGLFFVTEGVAFRVDGRYRWRVADERLGSVYCDPEPIGCRPYTTDLFSTAELTGGVTFRF
jgi:hypothetical protein